MSQYPTPMQPVEAPSEPRGGGLAIAAFVLALIGLVVPLLPLVALVLGIIALTKRSANRGLAIASVCIAPVGLLCCAGGSVVMLPAMYAARLAARQMVDEARMHQIAVAMAAYAGDNGGSYPEAGADWKARIEKYFGPSGSEALHSPREKPGQESFFYIGGHTRSEGHPSVIVFENPELWRVLGGKVFGGAVMYDDGNFEWVEGDKYEKMAAHLESQRRAAEAGARKGSGP